MYLIQLNLKNGQKYWFHGTKSDCKRALKYLGTIYKSIKIEEKE
jgi:hypothetical protein